jgi:hypothetical protein
MPLTHARLNVSQTLEGCGSPLPVESIRVTVPVTTSVSTHFATIRDLVAQQFHIIKPRIAHIVELEKIPCFSVADLLDRLENNLSKRIS